MAKCARQAWGLFESTAPPPPCHPAALQAGGRRLAPRVVRPVPSVWRGGVAGGAAGRRWPAGRAPANLQVGALGGRLAWGLAGRLLFLAAREFRQRRLAERLLCLAARSLCQQPPCPGSPQRERLPAARLQRPLTLSHATLEPTNPPTLPLPRAGRPSCQCCFGTLSGTSCHPAVCTTLRATRRSRPGARCSPRPPWRLPTPGWVGGWVARTHLLGLPCLLAVPREAMRRLCLSLCSAWGRAGCLQ